MGDWIVGTGSKRRNRQGFLVYVMCVAETLTLNEYWVDPRFQRKKPNLGGSLKQAFGDNIYFRDETGHWHQEDSHHSYQGGTPNYHNVLNDTQTDRVLIGVEYAYWGGSGPKIPDSFRDYKGHDICVGRNHKCHFPQGLANDFVAWFHMVGKYGYQGDPLDWHVAS